MPQSSKREVKVTWWGRGQGEEGFRSYTSVGAEFQQAEKGGEEYARQQVQHRQGTNMANLEA